MGQVRLRFGLLYVVACVAVFVTAVQSVSININLNGDLAKEHKLFSSPNNTQLGKEMLAIMNTSVNPCADFYEYSCGSWLASFPMPSDSSRWALATDTVNNNNLITLKKILEDPSGEWPVIGPFYNACMDMEYRDSLDVEALPWFFDDLEGIQSIEDLMSYVGILHSFGIPALFSVGVAPDAMNPTLNMLQLSQGGLSLDVPDDYNTSDSSSAQLVKQFRDYVSTITDMIDDDGLVYSEDIFDVEQTLARGSLSPEDLRDPYATYHNITLTQLEDMTPNIGTEAWFQYFSAMSIFENAEYSNVSVNVAVPSFFSALSDSIPLLTDDYTNFGPFIHYLRFKVLDWFAPHLSHRFVNAHFAFYGTILSGQKHNAPLWKRCVEQTDSSLGGLLGRYFVMDAFPPEAKDLAVDMMGRVEGGFLRNLASVDWMDDVTRKLAAQKLAMVDELIGYPDHWSSFTEVSQDAYASNVLGASQWAVQDEFAQLLLPVDRNRWQMTTPTVNAYYDPSLNEIVFPAGILQAPWFFDVNYPPQINYGGTASAMGHELTHGFDDQGANYDGTGKLHQWWPKKVKDLFDERTQCVANLYSSFEVLPGLFINGNLTLGENVADIGGLHASFVAYLDYAASLPQPPPEVIPGIDDKQLFFIAYAISWCEMDTAQALTRQVKSNPHSPAKFRVNGPVSQLPAFSKAFNCPTNAPLNPPQRCDVW